MWGPKPGNAFVSVFAPLSKERHMSKYLADKNSAELRHRFLISATVFQEPGEEVGAASAASRY